MRSYLTVWRLPSAPVLLLSGFAGRLPSSMVPLALLLMVQEQTGSYAVAGGVSATYGIATALIAPVLGRLADRRSPRIVLLAQSALYPLLPPTLGPAAPRPGGRRRPRWCAGRGDARCGRRRRREHATGRRNRARAVVPRGPRRS